MYITDGVNTLNVPTGAFKMIYKDMGFVEVKEEKSYTEQYLDEPEKSKDEIFIEELMEKPISEWKAAEVKKFAELKNIDISEANNKDEAKEIIKKFLDSAE